MKFELRNADEQLFCNFLSYRNCLSQFHALKAGLKIRSIYHPSDLIIDFEEIERRLLAL